MGRYSIQDKHEVRKILRQACARRELLILATPFMHFESTFISLSKDELLVGAAMGEEEATYGLRVADLKVRFPHGTGFLEAQVRMQGLGDWQNTRVVRLTIPETLQDDDHRAAYRVERVEPVEVTYLLPEATPQTGRLRNISTTGLRLELPEAFSASELKIGQILNFSIPLTKEITISHAGRIRYVRGGTLGAEFTPMLDEAVLQPLSRWVFVRKEEDQSLREHALKINPDGVLLLVSHQAELEQALAAVLVGLPPIQRVAPNLQALQEGLAQSPSLLILHIDGADLALAPSLRRMAAYLAGHWPFLLLGTGLDNAPLFELGTELKATSSYLLGPTSGTFFHRLVGGILRRHEGASPS